MIYKPGAGAGLFYCQNFEVLTDWKLYDNMLHRCMSKLIAKSRGEIWYMDMLG